MIFGFLCKRVSTPPQWKLFPSQTYCQTNIHIVPGDAGSRTVRIATFTFHWKLFPSFAIARIE
jgi:hypothetical protein